MSKADIIMTGNVYVSINKYINGVCPDAKYVAASLKSVRSLKCYFRSEASWNRIYYRTTFFHWNRAQNNIYRNG